MQENVELSEKALERKEDWYKRPDVQMQIIKSCYGREVSMLGERNVRGLNLNTLSFLNFVYKKVGLLKYSVNMYQSLDVYNDFPNFSFNMQKRQKQMDEFKENYYKYYGGTDYALDFDCKCKHLDKNLQGGFCCDKYNKDVFITKDCKDCEFKNSGFLNMIEEVAFIKSLYDEYKVPYFINCTENGISMRVRFDYTGIDFNALQGVKDKLKNETVHEILRFYASMTQELINSFDFRSVDTSIYTMWRVFKVPYSLGKITGIVVMPLSDSQFDDLYIKALKGEYTCMDDVKWLKPENIEKGMMDNRGLFIRKGNSENFERFVAEIVNGVEFIKENVGDK